MFRSRLTMIAAVTLISFAGPAFADGGRNINKRQARQQARIYQGVKSGELTLRETKKLEAAQARIDVLEAKDRRSGDGLNKAERAELEHLLNVQSHNIYRLKHDGPGK